MMAGMAMPLPGRSLRHTSEPVIRSYASSALGGEPTWMGCEGEEPAGLSSLPSPTITTVPYTSGADIRALGTLCFQRTRPLAGSTAYKSPWLLPTYSVPPAIEGDDENPPKVLSVHVAESEPRTTALLLFAKRNCVQVAGDSSVPIAAASMRAITLQA